ncbi:transcription repressor OFP17-like [Lycium ferocissimum]|uniref:transcription repressor OFP17-like n=1 Tax=Lycium ferocissimum TaxID=112874 RepID=UPI002815BE45|nr:transcription repressor OFP17-like [Lycium ferocissimum]
MKVKAFGPLKCKLSNPCKKILRLFKFRLRKPLFIRRLKFRRSVHETDRSTPRNRGPQIQSDFRLLRRRGREEDQVMELKSFSEVEHHRAPFPSPLTPAYVRLSAAIKKEVLVHDDVEDSCRSFENYLMEMVVEEGKMRDLADVEELLYCWKNLKSPVFIELVCRFYGEL